MLIIMLGLLAATFATKANAKTYVVAIGNNRGHSHEAPLLYAERDARQFMGTLQRFSDTQARDTVLLQGRGAAEIVSTLRRIKQEVENLSPAERARTKLIVYYSGHADGRGLHPGRSSIAYRRLRSEMQSTPAQVRILVVDGCRSGGLTRVKGATPVTPFDITTEDKLQSSGFVMISSSTATEDSHESDRLQGSFFTHHFLNALRGIADFNEDGKVSLHESFTYAYHQTLRSSSSTLSLQHPTLDTRLRGKGDLTLSTPEIAKSETSAVILSTPAVYLVAQDKKNGNIVAELQTHRNEQVLRLAPGDYRIQHRGPLQYRNYHLRLRGGETVHLDREEPEVLAYEQLVRKGGPKPASNTLQFNAGIRGPLAHQSKWSSQINLGYTLHLEHLSLSTRTRVAYGRFRHQKPHQSIHTHETEVALGLSIEKYVDLKKVSLGFGLWAEALYLQQATQGPSPEARRHSFGAAFGGSFALQFPLAKRMGLRLEVGPVTYILRRSKLNEGVESDTSSVATPVTGFAQVGTYLSF